MPGSIRIIALGAVLPGVLWTAPAVAQLTPAPGVCDRQALHAWLAADSQRVSLGDARISLVPPPGMRGLAPAEAAQITNEPSDLAFANDEGTVVSIRSSDGEMENQAMVLRMIYSRVETDGTLAGRFDWIRQGEAVELGGHPSVLYEYVHRALRERRDRYVRHYWINLQGQTTVVRFSADPRRRSEVSRSAATLRVHDCAWADGAAAESAREASASTANPRSAQRDTVPCTEQALREHVAAARPPRASMAGGRVSMVPPQGLPRVEYPRAGDRELTFMVDPGTSVIVSFLEDSMNAAGVRRMSDMIFGEDLRWSSRAPVEIGGVRWERLGYTGNLVGTEQRTEIYITPFQGKTLMVNATVIPTGEEARWRPRMEASIATLEVRNCRLTDSAPSS